MDGTVQICRGFAVAQWKTLYARLINRDGTNSDDQEPWRCAIEVFERRIRERFLSCIEALEAADSRLDISIPAEAPANCSSLPEQKEAVVPGFAIMGALLLAGGDSTVIPLQDRDASQARGTMLISGRTVHQGSADYYC
jgi:hypothetical protein